MNPRKYRYIKAFDDLVEDLVLLDDLLSARFGFQPSSCTGHFPNFPALPVAVLMYILGKAAAKLLEEVTGTKDVLYGVVDAQIDAENLAFPDEKLYLVVQLKDGETNDRQHSFRCRAVSEGKERHKFGELALTVQVNEP